MDVFNSGVGHWSQMAWGNTIQIGCGVTWCPNASSPMTIVVCQYSPPGNFIGSNIYEAGNPCTANADCTTIANSFCNASLGLCSTTAVASSTASNSTGSSAAASTARPSTARATTARTTATRRATTTRRRSG
uniref:SCP domain-containing protein n=1 Tax=Ditylenchus dipsaci TaxID=166011 RepID=A0A915DQE9_9BILA